MKRKRAVAMVFWLFAGVLVLGGIAGMFAVDWWTGFPLLVLGFFVALLQVLDIRRASTARKHVCPRCGLMIPEGSKYCTNCDYKIE